MIRSAELEKVAVVTGASQGIGRAIALRMATEGYQVWAVARRQLELDELNSDSGGRVVSAACDLTDSHLVEELTRRLATVAPVDALVHCAGSITHGSVAGTAPEQLAAEFTNNVEATYRLTQLVLPLFAGAGSIVFLNSSQGIRATAGTSQYAASMHARKALADALRDEVNERGIRVTSIYPGRVATPRQEAIYARNGWSYRPDLLLQPEDIADVVATILGLPATAEVTDLHIRPAIKSY